MLTQERLRELLTYRPDTGEFVWRKKTSNRVKIGERAGRVAVNGYRGIRIDNTLHYAHRLAYLYVTGGWPSEQIDHINRVRDDNRWCNLRPATCSENQQNLGLAPTNTSGYRGVSYHRAARKWSAERWVAGVKHYLGLFPTAEAARTAWLEFSLARGLIV